MKKFKYENFIKRYDKFKKNNLPTPFWDEERQVREYVYFYNGKSIINSQKFENELVVYPSLSVALGNIAFTGFYYSFTDRHITPQKKNGKTIINFEVGHNHAHSFEEVVKHLYNSPESFSISKDEEQFYSKQELEYLRRVQKYLLFIGLKDLTTNKIPKSRFKNKLHSKYESALIYTFDDHTIDAAIKGEKDFYIRRWVPGFPDPKTYKSKEFQALIVDKEDNFKMFVEFTYEELKTYKDIKVIEKGNRFKLKNDDKVLVIHFKILEVFK